MLLLLLRPLRRRCCATHTIIRTHYSYSGPGHYTRTLPVREALWKDRDFRQRGFTVGIGGPVGSGKTALVLALCRATTNTNTNTNTAACHDMLPRIDGVVTNDIFTAEDAQFLTHHQALPADRIRAVETGGCPHAAIREDVSMNLSALEELTQVIAAQTSSMSSTSMPPLLLCESGGDNLAAQFSTELADLTIYVMDVAGGTKVPRKGGPGVCESDILVINKTDLADAVGSDLNVMERDAVQMRGPDAASTTILASVKHGDGLAQIQRLIAENYHRAWQVSKEA